MSDATEEKQSGSSERVHSPGPEVRHRERAGGRASFTRLEFQELFLSQRDRIFSLLQRLTRNAQDAEDLMQETFLMVWRKRELFRGDGAPEGFLRTTAVRLYINTYQRRIRRPRTSSSEYMDDLPQGPIDENFSAELERKEALEFLGEKVQDALAELPDHSREAFVLFRYEGFSCAQIAELMETPLKTIETRLRRATLYLAGRLERYRSLLPVS